MLQLLEDSKIKFNDKSAYYFIFVIMGLIFPVILRILILIFDISISDIKNSFNNRIRPIRKLKIAEKYKYCIVVLYLILFSFVFGKFISISLNALRSEDFNLSINFKDCQEVFINIISLVITVMSVISSLFLPSNIVTMLLFICLTLFIIYLIKDANFLSVKIKMLLGLIIPILMAFGYNLTKSKVEIWIEKIKKAVENIRSSHSTIIPYLLTCSFIIALQTLISSVIKSNTNNFWVYIIPVILLGDWTFNIVCSQMHTSSTYLFYEKNENSIVTFKDLFVVTSEYLSDIVVVSFNDSVFSVVTNLKRLSNLFYGSQGGLIPYLNNFELIFETYFNLKLSYNEEYFQKLILNDLLKKKSEYSNTNEMDQKAADEKVLSEDSIVFYLLNYKNLAFRIPAILSLFPFSDSKFLNTILNSAVSFEFIKKPIFFFQLIAEKPSIVSLIGLTLYLTLVFYILLIPISYRANSEYEKSKIQINKTLDISTGTKDGISSKLTKNLQGFLKIFK